jgi:TonB family protein
MNRKLLALAAVAAVFGVINFASRASQTAPQAPFQALLSPANCAQPQWPAEARRYEIEGTTTIRFEIGQDGKVLQPTVTQGSGWSMLDQAALQGITRCVFQPNLEAARQQTAFPLQYVWKLNGPAAARPALVADSCQPSERFTAFREADQHSSDQHGILLRFLLNADGAPVRVVAEPNGQPPALVAQAADYLQSCRFAYAAGAAGERTDTGFGRVMLK